jgi:hypothetical protein
MLNLRPLLYIVVLVYFHLFHVIRFLSFHLFKLCYPLLSPLFLFLLDLFVLFLLCSWFHSASNRDEHQKQNNNVSGE